MSSFLSEIALMVVVGGGSALLVRFVMPVVLEIVTILLVAIVSVVASVALLLDLMVAALARRRSIAPPRWVYEYGDAVGAVAYVVRHALRHGCRGLVWVARTTPLGLVAAVAAGIQLVSVLT